MSLPLTVIEKWMVVREDLLDAGHRDLVVDRDVDLVGGNAQRAELPVGREEIAGAGGGRGREEDEDGVQRAHRESLQSLEVGTDRNGEGSAFE
jgi:hypothetical protein